MLRFFLSNPSAEQLSTEIRFLRAKETGLCLAKASRWSVSELDTVQSQKNNVDNKEECVLEVLKEKKRIGFIGG